MTGPSAPATLSRTGTFPDFPPLADGWLDDARRVRDGRFRLIGEEYHLGHSFSWRVNPSRDKEWQIAQHKFVFAPGLVQATIDSGDPAYLDTWVSLVRSWLDEMGSGAVTLSDAQVEAKRVEHWVWSLALLEGTGWAVRVPAELRGKLVERIGQEARYIGGHLKPVRNHRTFELYAVALAAICFPGIDSDGDLRRTAVELLSENLLTDVRPDGVHCELSSHYHQLVTETAVGFLELCHRNGIVLSAALKDRIHKAVTYSLWLQWPDGNLPLIGDADNGRHQDLLGRGAALFADETLRFGATLGSRGRAPSATARRFAEAGYVVLRDRWGTDADKQRSSQHVFYDCAKLGEGSHSHYDLFSFTYFADGGPAIVDPGRFTYSSERDADGTDWRHHFKSTLAHNTVTVDGRDQTRYLSRTKHGPDVELAEVGWSIPHEGPSDAGAWVTGRATSNEYAPTHRRTLLFPRSRYLILVDQVDGVDAEEHSYQARFHLPDLAADLSCGADGAVLTGSRCTIRCVSPHEFGASVVPDWVSTAYGVKTPAAVLDVSFGGLGQRTLVSVVAPRSAPPATVSLSQDGAGTAVRVVHAAGDDLLLLGDGSTVRHRGAALDGRFALVTLTEDGTPTAVSGHQVVRLDLPGGIRLSGDRVRWHA